MKIAVAIPNHNQGPTVMEAIGSLSCQTVSPSHIFVMSDDTPFGAFSAIGTTVVNIDNGKENAGRCGNRNSVIGAFLASGDDALIFIDGDCQAKDIEFIRTYEQLMSKHDLVFSCREHSPVDGIAHPASDLLTANMDNLWEKKPLDYTDLRIVSGAVEAWQEAHSFSEKVDLMITGMIGWSCNFGITRDGLEQLLDFMEKTHGRRELFDSEAFSHGWGYEDVAMGLDAMYAGLDVWISASPVVLHRAHPRSDGLFDHVKGRHMIMDRYRSLQKNLDKHIRHAAYCAVAAVSFILGLSLALL